VTRSTLNTNVVPLGSSSPGSEEVTAGESSLAPPLLPPELLFGIGWDLSGHDHEH
jgi:hypothetical protein